MEEMTDDQRALLARAVASKVVGMGSKRAVYQAADVSAPTLERVLEGKSVKPFTITAIVNVLWPQAGGDWRQVPGMSEDSEAGAEVPSQSSSLEARVAQLELRIERLELLGRPGIHTERSDIGRIRALESELTALRENSDADDLVSDGGTTMEPIAALTRDVQEEFDESND